MLYPCGSMYLTIQSNNNYHVKTIISDILLSCLTFTLTWAEDSGKKVKGRVCDENKQPIIGANVYWEGTQNGTTSDVDGNFELERKVTPRIWWLAISVI